MSLHNRVLVACLLTIAVSPGFIFGQKVKVDYDRSVEFANFKTYTWAQLDPTHTPLLTMNIIGAIDEQLAAKGLVKVDKDADLVVAYSGGVEGSELNQGVSAPTYPGYTGPPPAVNSTMWTGSAGAGGGGTGVSYPKGTLVVELMDPHAAKITWRAVGSVKLDIEKKTESLARINSLVEKMFVSYPPPKK